MRKRILHSKGLKFSVLVVALLGLALLGCSYGIDRAKANPVHEGEEESSTQSPEVWSSPLPWTEVCRVTSPDNSIDAVLVTRPDSGPPDYLLANPTDLFIVESGKEIEREPATRLSSGRSIPYELAKFRERMPFHSYDAKGTSLRWKDDATLLVGAKEAIVYKKDGSFQVNVAGTTRKISIDYFIEWDSWAEKSGPALPKN